MRVDIEYRAEFNGGSMDGMHMCSSGMLLPNFIESYSDGKDAVGRLYYLIGYQWREYGPQGQIVTVEDYAPTFELEFKTAEECRSVFPDILIKVDRSGDIHGLPVLCVYGTYMFMSFTPSEEERDAWGQEGNN